MWLPDYQRWSHCAGPPLIEIGMRGEMERLVRERVVVVEGIRGGRLRGSEPFNHLQGEFLVYLRSQCQMRNESGSRFASRLCSGIQPAQNARWQGHIDPLGLVR